MPDVDDIFPLDELGVRLLVEYDRAPCVTAFHALSIARLEVGIDEYATPVHVDGDDLRSCEHCGPIQLAIEAKAAAAVGIATARRLFWPTSP